ncbi:MAG TPA: hypothetical protein ENN31_01975 [Candidatus Vogelbacteria bacterium]|nr:hypothetical protein [Candidatus Vogelbacteria bacterium]
MKNKNNFLSNLSTASSPNVFFFIGRSGCGKGTQAKKLVEDIQKADPERKLFYIETGDRFREFVSGDSHSSRIAKEIMERSEAQPPFLAIWLWSNFLISNFTGDEHLVFDGTPRTLTETKALDGAREFYNWSSPVVVHLKVSRAWAYDRLSGRGRKDDLRPGDIESRLDWFDRLVLPAIEYYQDNPNYRFLEINGEQSIEEVYQEILDSLSFVQKWQ